jgi:hypothetical protein
LGGRFSAPPRITSSRSMRDEEFAICQDGKLVIR